MKPIHFPDETEVLSGGMCDVEDLPVARVSLDGHLPVSETIWAAVSAKWAEVQRESQ